MLEKRPFGRTGLSVSPLTFGAWSIGGPAQMGGKQIGWSGVNDADSLDALKAARDAGINLFDTADAYGRGHSETLLGRAFPKSVREYSKPLMNCHGERGGGGRRADRKRYRGWETAARSSRPSCTRTIASGSKRPQRRVARRGRCSRRSTG